MKFWFGYDYETLKAVDIFKNEKINKNGINTIGKILQYDKSIEAICAVSSTFWKVFNTIVLSRKKLWRL